MPLTTVLTRLMGGLDLTREEAYGLMSVFADGNAPAEQVAGILVALQTKGATPSELAGLARFLRERAVPLAHDEPRLVDTCGTGGGKTTFNLSTGAAIVACAAGAKVAKHGNRSVTSKCGSADVLEHLGVNLTGDGERLSHLLTQTGIVFLFAPHHHGSMKAVGPVRKALGVRTVFNQLGPLANPAGARRQLIGVYDRALIRPMADALVLLEAEHSFVVHSEDGMDEISPCAPTNYAEVIDGKVEEGVFKPKEFGVHDMSVEALKAGDTVETSAEFLRSALDNSHSGRSEALIPNASVALLLSGECATLLDAALLARETLRNGAAWRKMEQLVEASSQ